MLMQIDSAKQCNIVEKEEVQAVKLLECLQLEHDKQDCLIIFRYWLWLKFWVDYVSA